MSFNNQFFLYTFFIFLALVWFGLIIKKVFLKVEKDKNNKIINDYLLFLKENNPSFYDYYKNKSNRTRAFYFRAQIYQVSKDTENKYNKELDYARKNNLNNIPLKEIRKIMRKNGL